MLRPVLLSALLVACATMPTPAVEAPPASPIRAIADAYWEFQMERAPTWATYLGDRRFDDRLPDLSDATHERQLARLRELKAQVEATSSMGLTPQDAVTRDVLLWTLQDELDGEVCRTRLWDINQLDGYQALLPLLPDYHSIETRKNADDLVVRYKKMLRLFGEHIANLQKGLTMGITAPDVVVKRVIEQLTETLKVPAEKSSFMRAADRLPPTWPQADRDAVRTAMLQAVQGSAYPGLKAYLQFLKTTYLPAARPAVGVSANPDGPRCYAYRIRHSTTLDRDPKALADLGTKELAAIQVQMKAISKSMGGTDDLVAFIAQLKADKSQYVATREGLLDAHRKILERATAALPKAFGLLPARPPEVKPIEEYREREAVAAYYYAGPDDGSRPAIYYVNTYKPETRPLYDAEALAFHEAVPGHHLQISVAQNQKALPHFRREMGPDAYVEGWALYAERLSDEMGLYSSPAARFGMLNLEAWRACRLVIDTGMHAFGWTRQQAIDFLTKNTALPEPEAVNEVDRYIADPGQALAYKVGQLEIVALRDEAKKRLGDRFDLRAFHDRFLEVGAVPLPIARKWMTDWLDGAARLTPMAAPSTGVPPPAAPPY
jgi:uncharacterized protein (DUF885 family)